MQDATSSVRNLIIGMLLLAIPFGIAYFLTRNNDNSQILLIIAIACVALALAFGMASGVQAVGTIAIRLSGRSSRDLLVFGLAALAILTPWTIAITVAGVPRIFGWSNPFAWILALGLVLSVMESARPYHGQALVAAGLALVVWVVWASWQVTTPAFRHWNFSFMPVDLISTGWYAGLVGFLLAVDGFSAGRAREASLVRARDVWPLALVPGMGLLRLGFPGRARLWLLAAALAAAFVGVSAVNDSEFTYWAHYNEVPPDRGRLDVVIAAGALGLIMLGSWLDTARALRRRVSMGDWLARVRARDEVG
ncbi:MAG TPA: hypothetical protein VIT43_07640 [Candidatus Dormibacteraeota bacterium]